MDETQALDAFSSLSSADRLRILRALVLAGEDGMTAGNVAQHIEATPSRASFHLSQLSQAGLIRSTKQARQVIYHAELQTVGALMRYLLEDCCQGSETVRACCLPGSCC